MEARSAPEDLTDLEWREISRRAALASHRLIGWIFWDPVGIANYAAAGVPDGLGYYIATRAAPLAAAGPEVVTATFGSIHPDFVAFSLAHCQAHTTFDVAARCRDDAVVTGLETYVPEIVDGLGAMEAALWDVADGLPGEGRALYAAHSAWPRPEGPAALRAWLALNCIREWRGDTHWAVQIAHGLSPTASGILDGAWRAYEDEWLPRSRGASDGDLAAAMAELDARGFVTNGRVNAAGVAYRQDLEDHLDDLTALPWRRLGASPTRDLLELVEPVGERLVARVDATAGENWMPAARTRRSALLDVGTASGQV